MSRLEDYSTFKKGDLVKAHDLYDSSIGIVSLFYAKKNKKHNNFNHLEVHFYCTFSLYCGIIII